MHLMPLMCSECSPKSALGACRTAWAHPFIRSSLHVRACPNAIDDDAVLNVLPGCSSRTRPPWDNLPSWVFCAFHPAPDATLI